MFNDIILNGIPGTYGLLKVSATAINEVLVKDGFNVINPDTYILAYIRECIPGEFQSIDNKCISCPPGLFSVAKSALECSTCPQFTSCPGGSTLDLFKGYWRSSNMTDQIYECYNTDACLGGKIDLENGISTCQDGYKGSLCHSCG